MSNLNQFTDHEKCIIAHRFHLPSEVRAKLHESFLKVWDVFYLDLKVKQEGLHRFIELGGIKYKINSSVDWKEILCHRKIGLSFRALDATHGYVIIKPWREIPEAERTE